MTDPVRSTRRGSLRLRLLAGTLVWIAVSIVLAGWGLGDLFRSHVQAQFQAELTTHLDQLTAQLTLADDGRVQLSQPLSDPRLGRPYSGLYWQVDQLDGAAPRPGVLRSRSLWDQVLIAPAASPVDGDIRSHRIPGPEGKGLGRIERSVRIDDPGGGPPHRLRLIVAADESLMEAPVSRFRGVLWLALGGLGGGLVVAALVQVFVGLAPLRSLRAALSKVRSGDTQRLEGAFPAEITPLIDEFNSVLAHDADVVERARTQAGNLAHALKTPLSVLANAAHAAAPGDPLATLVRDQVAAARRQVDYHLSRAQAAARLPGARCALAPVIDGLVRTMQRIHAERRLSLVVAPMDAVPAFRGDAQDLQEMLGNLLDNACKWAGARVEVQARGEGAQLCITIDDDGAGLAPEQRAAVLQRGVRADEQVPGTGLGLAIVDDLARLYGGSVCLDASPLGGVRATLSLPAAGSPGS